MTRKKRTNSVLAANGGLHSARTLKLVEQLLKTHDLNNAILYQFILSGSPSKPDYQAAIKALIRHIRTKCRAEYVGAYEAGDEKGGLHCHCYILIETKHHFPSDLLDVSEGKFLNRLIKRKKLSIRIEPPKNRMHDGQMFARMNTPAKLADCIVWVSYGLKSRSKEDVPGRETYFGSEFASNIAKREAQRQKYRDALTKSFPPVALPAAVTTLTESKEQNETNSATQYEAGSGSESFTADRSTEASVKSAGSTAMVGTGCESIEARARSTSSTKAEDQRRRGIGRTDTADEEVNLTGLLGCSRDSQRANLAELIGRSSFPAYRLPVGSGVEMKGIVNPAVKVYNCLTVDRRSYTHRSTE